MNTNGKVKRKSFQYCTVTNKCKITINSQITTVIHILTLSCHLQGGTVYELPEEDTTVSKHV